MTIYIVNAIGISLILFIIIWFWLAKLITGKFVKTKSGIIDITVDNGVYTPALIKVKAGEKIQLRFYRKDASPCAEWVIFQKINRSEELPLHKPHLIELKIDQPGEYDFTCQMNMYRGKLIVE